LCSVEHDPTHPERDATRHEELGQRDTLHVDRTGTAALRQRSLRSGIGHHPIDRYQCPPSHGKPRPPCAGFDLRRQGRRIRTTRGVEHAVGNNDRAGLEISLERSRESAEQGPGEGPIRKRRKTAAHGRRSHPGPKPYQRLLVSRFPNRQRLGSQHRPTRNLHARGFHG